MPGDRINALLINVDINSAGPSLIVSRATPDFVVKLFEREVAEIHDGVVKIMGIAREPGRRTKIAVSSDDPRIDPVGACVGIRGTRVRNITDELGNERVDIVPYDKDLAKYAANALLPAKVQSVEIDEEKHELQVTVNEEQSKIAFGRKAQNVRLSAKLLGWNITLKNESSERIAPPSIAEQIKVAAAKLAAELGVRESTAALLVSNGYVTLDGIRAAERSALLAIDGIDADELEKALDALQQD